MKEVRMLTQMADTVTIAESGRRAGMHPNNIRYWVLKGRLEAIPTPLGKVITRASLERFLEDRERRQKETVAS